MQPVHLARRFRGLLAASILAAGPGVLLDHHHDDHDGTLLHLEEDHGSHGETVAPAADRLPAAGLSAVTAAPEQATTLPDLVGPAIHPTAEPDNDVRATGHDPPNARGPRGPPLPRPELHRAA